jgi:hypothetical protein
MLVILLRKLVHSDREPTRMLIILLRKLVADYFVQKKPDLVLAYQKMQIGKQTANRSSNKQKNESKHTNQKIDHKQIEKQIQRQIRRKEPIRNKRSQEQKHREKQ